MRFYPKDQGLTSFLSELWASRRAAETPPPIDRQAGGQAGAGIPSSPSPTTQQTFSAPQQEEPRCNPHPDAPHGFDRNSSHTLGRYVCDCEGWSPEE